MGPVCPTERFAYDWKLADGIMSRQHIFRVARGKEDLDAFAHSYCFACKLDAVYSGWHDDIAEQKIELLAVSTEAFAIRGEGDSILYVFEKNSTGSVQLRAHNIGGSERVYQKLE